MTVGLSADGKISIFNFAGTTHVIVDVAGWHSGFHPITPSRVMDTRHAQGGGVFGPAETRDLPIGGVGDVPADAVAVALNVTVTEPTMAGYLTVFPAGSSLPTASNLNFVPGQSIPNMVTVGLGTELTGR